MKENEANFIGEFFSLIAKYNVSFSACGEPTYIYVGDRQIATISEDDGITSIDVNVSLE